MPLDISPQDTLAELDAKSRDYVRMEAALSWLADHWQDHPSLEDAADAVGLSPHHFQRMFTRWAGVSPKTFVAAIAHAEARQALGEGETVLDAAFDAGLSGPSRLHDLFIAHEAVTPGEARQRGEGVDIAYGYAPTPFGIGLFALTDRGLAVLAFVDDEDAAFEDMHRRWPAASWTRDDERAKAAAMAIFAGQGERPPLVLMGPPFHIQVWKALLTIPEGRTASYGEIGRASCRERVSKQV